jgi:D-alanyl-D-alanine carboxypeptidase
VLCALALPVLLALVADPAGSGSAAQPPLPRTPVTRILPGFVPAADEVMARTYSYPAPGAVALVAREGRVVYRRAFGLADLEYSVMLEPDMVFRIGSVTKQFTAFAILLLADRGALALDDDIHKYVPEFETGGRHVTLEHLLTHTSGLPNYTDLPQWRALWGTDVKPMQLLDLVRNRPFEFEPGAEWRYSDSGYMLLGEVIERVGGKPYAEFMREQVLVPLGLSRTMYDDTMRVIPRRARGYVKDGDEYLNAPYLSMTHPFAAGGLISTVDDLARWDAEITASRLIKPESVERMFTPFHLTSGASAGYGLGWSLTTYESHPVAQHGGGIPGFSSFVIRMPEDRVYVVVLSNCVSGAAGRVAKLLAALAIGRPFKDPREVTLAAATLDAYVGRYKGPHDGFELSRKNSHLLLEGNRDAIELMASSGTEFFEPGGPLRVSVVKDPSGAVAAIRLWGWGEPVTATRVN